ncbi:hypothetical protein Hypma_010613 [Hypsizygus marmoreus]|uniref:Uncharacterized protein n=1 Tax=Hypsizygus marmoreus TaxID=39966 RepID=A0A369JP68_HYPMA|nr:hypothetical protein Hypma_010613 [Hypsizygus marmoreus]
MQFKTLTIAIALSLVSVVQGIVVAPRSALDVFVPPITKPDAQTIWTVGHVESVIWDASDAPANISNRASVILNPVIPGVRLNLTSGFDLRTGLVEVTVPDVDSGQYTITLFGDSGNISPIFHIVD